ncbi:MAG: phytase [Actinomycetota bacterium]
MLVVAAACARPEPLPSVAPTAETAPVRSSDDAADDPAVWVHPTDPARSLVIGTDRRAGLGVWDLSGREVQFLTGIPTDNVDVRSLDGPAGARPLVAASGWDDRMLHLFTRDADRSTLVEAGTVRTGVAAAGLCLWRAPSGQVHAFVMSETGVVEQWELREEGGRFAGSRVRGPWQVGGETEGCVADDELGHLYVGEENRGVWRYDASPGAPAGQRTLVDDVDGGRLVPDVEGLTLTYGPGGEGLLLVSSQGDNSFAAYRRGGANAYVGRFRVDGDGGVDGCEDTDGVDAVATPLAPSFPSGLFVCQDGRNGDERQNFKLVDLGAVVGLLGASP